MIFKKFGSGFHALKNLYAANGFGPAFRELGRWFRYAVDPAYACRSLIEAFPQKFDAPSLLQQPIKERMARVDSVGAEVTQELLKRLEVREEAGRILPALKDNLGKAKYYRSLDNIFTLEQFEQESSHSSRPLVRASDLPELNSSPHRRCILFIASQFPSPYHGGGNRVLNFIRFLSEENDIYLATSFSAQKDRADLDVIRPYCKDILKIPPQDFGGNQNEILKWLAGKRMDVVHYEWPQSLKNFDRAYGPCQIFTYMEMISLRLKMELQALEPLSAAWLRTLADLFLILRLEVVEAAVADARITVAGTDGSFLRSIYPYQGYIVLNHGVTFEEFCLPEIESDPHTLVFVGNYEHEPNVNALAYFFGEIWDNICEEIPDACIYVVGAQPPQTVQHLSDGKRIIVTGRVPDVRPYIQKASVCIAPLQSGAGLRGKVIEYAALRRPFVATSIATADLVFRNGVDYFCADSAKEFARKTVLLLNNPALGKRMADSAFETARSNYDTRRLVNFLYRIYEYLESR